MTAAGFNTPEFRVLRELVQARTGLNFSESRLQDLESGVHRAMANVGSTDLERFAGLLDADQRAFDALIANITVAETYFFREPAQFQVLRQVVLPDIRKRLSPGIGIRVWSAGCASGEEPYSLAILLEQEGLAAHGSILATDISRAALERARDASYGAWSLRGAPTDALMRCFDRHGDRFVLQDRFRERVDFRYLNLASSAYPKAETGTTDIDLILCRNVLIYFDPETIQRVGQQLFKALRVGGWLITGPSDPPLWDYAPYRTIVTAAGVFYQRSEAQRSVQSVTAPPVMDLTKIEPVVAVAEMPALIDVPPVAEPAAEDSIDCAAWVSRVRALADRGASHGAETEALAALRVYSLSPELHYLHAIVLLELGRHEEAAGALRRVIYLDPSLALAHFMLGSVLARLGVTAEARRSYQNALDLCLRRPQEEILPLSDHEPTGSLAAAARTQIALLGKAGGRAQ